jgi:hypothetical protein
MEKEKIQKAISDLRSLGMSSEEKNVMLNRIMGEEMRPAVHISSWTTIIWRNFMVEQSWRSTMVVAALILILTGGSVAFAAETTLPGDRLYTVKTGMTERLLAAVSFSNTAKVYIEELKIERRVKEAAKLAAQGRLDDKVNAEIQEQIGRSAKKVAELISGK